jgi:hypothetical protein
MNCRSNLSATTGHNQVGLGELCVCRIQRSILVVISFRWDGRSSLSLATHNPRQDSAIRQACFGGALRLSMEVCAPRPWLYERIEYTQRSFPRMSVVSAISMRTGFDPAWIPMGIGDQSSVCLVEFALHLWHGRMFYLRAQPACKSHCQHSTQDVALVSRLAARRSFMEIECLLGHWFVRLIFGHFAAELIGTCLLESDSSGIHMCGCVFTFRPPRFSFGHTLAMSYLQFSRGSVAIRCPRPPQRLVWHVLALHAHIMHPREEHLRISVTIGQLGFNTFDLLATSVRECIVARSP